MRNEDDEDDEPLFYSESLAMLVLGGLFLGLLALLGWLLLRWLWRLI